LNVLYLVNEGLLDIPVLYLSRYIVSHKADYYRLLQITRDRDTWEEWVLYMLNAIESTAADTIETINAIKTALLDIKHRIRDQYRFYSQDLINNLFTHPYTKIDYVMRDLKVSRLTASKYLETLAADGILQKQKHGRSNYYINSALYPILTRQSLQ
jgi:Fic family protein